MRKLRSRLTFANVCSFLALSIALGTGGAYAANTVFSTDIVNGEVKTADLATNAVTTAKLANGHVRSVDVLDEGLTGVDIASDSLSGPDIAEASLQNVDASTVGGLQVRKINFQVPPGTGPTTVLDLAGLQITAECQNFGDLLDVKAFTSKNDASVYYFAGTTAFADDTNGQQDIDSDQLTNGFFDVGVQLQIDNATPFDGNDSIGTLNYTAPDGSVVVAHLALDEVHAIGGGVDRCVMTGVAIGG